MGLCEHLGQDNEIEEPCEDPPHSVNCEFAELDFRLPPLPPLTTPQLPLRPLRASWLLDHVNNSTLVLSESRLKELFFRVGFLRWIDYCFEIKGTK